MRDPGGTEIGFRIEIESGGRWIADWVLPTLAELDVRLP